MTAYRLQSGNPALATNPSTSWVQDVYSRVQLPAQYVTQPVSVNPSRRCLRSAARADLIISAPKTVCYGPHSFAVAGPATWNSLWASLRDDQLSVAAFPRLLKTELFSRAYDSSLARSW